MQRGEAALAGSPVGSPVDQLGAGECDHHQGVVARPFEDRLDEVDESRVGPLQIFEDHDRRTPQRDSLEERPPSREEFLTVAGRGFDEPEKVGEPRFDPSSLVGIGDELGHRGRELGPGRGGVLGFVDGGAHPHHLAERPERDALPVGGGAALVPVDGLGEAVHVLQELPGQTALADAGDARHRHEARPLLSRGGVEQVLDESKLLVPTDERGFQALRSSDALALGHDPKRPPGLDRLLLALQVERSDLGEGDSARGGPPSGLVDEHCARRGNALDPRGRVDGVTEHHAFCHLADRDRHLSGDDPGSGCQIHAGLDSELGDRRHHLEGRANGPLGIVLVRDRCSPDRHDRVPDELLDRACVVADDGLGASK